MGNLIQPLYKLNLLRNTRSHIISIPPKMTHEAQISFEERFSSLHNPNQCYEQATIFFKENWLWARNSRNLSYFELTAQAYIRPYIKYELFKFYIEKLNLKEDIKEINANFMIRELIFQNDMRSLTLLAENQILDLKNCYDCLLWGVQFGFWNIDFLKLCKKMNVSFDREFEGKSTALHKAISTLPNPHNMEFIDCMIKIYPENLNHQNIEGQTPLLLGLYKGDLNAVKLFLINNEESGKCDKNLNNLIHYCFLGSNLKLPYSAIKDLFENIENHLNMTPNIKSILFKQKNINKELPINLLVRNLKLYKIQDKQVVSVLMEFSKDYLSISSLLELANFFNEICQLRHQMIIGYEKIRMQFCVMIYLMIKVKFGNYGINMKFSWNILDCLIGIEKLSDY